MSLEDRIERLLEDFGYELVAMERGGGRRRPLLRLRIDRPGGSPDGSTVTVDDCAEVSRAVNEMLETNADAPADYILEVSSPGVERPLVRPRDYDRFVGRPVLLRGYAPLAKGRKELEGRLLGRSGEEAEAVALEVEGERLEVPLASIASARLVYRWEERA